MLVVDLTLSVLFAEFIPREEVALLGVEAAGRGLNTDRHAATLTLGTVVVY